MADKIKKMPAEQAEQDYMVCIRVTGRVLVPAKAINAEIAKNLANGEVAEMNFGELEDIDWGAVYAEDENGNRVDF